MIKSILLIFLLTFFFAKPIWSKRIGRQANAAQCKEGETTIQQSVFKYVCTNGALKFTACQARSTKAEIPAGETRTIDGFWYKCSNDNGQAGYSEENRCVVGTKFIHINETAILSNMVYYCTPKGVTITGCVFTNPTTGELVQAKVGANVQFGDTTHTCNGWSGAATGANTGPGGSGKSTDCINEGVQHKSGETWVLRTFKYVCAPGGKVRIIACIIDGDNEIPVGQSVAKFGLLHHCVKEDNRVSYKSEICDVNGVKCDAASVAKLNADTPIDKPIQSISSIDQSSGQGDTNPMGGGGSGNNGGGDNSGNNGNTMSGGNGNGNKGPQSSATTPATMGGTSDNSGNGNGNTMNGNDAHGSGDDYVCLSQDGKNYHAGETWQLKNFKFLCGKDGSASIVACVLDSKKEINVGETWVIAGTQHVCANRGNGNAAYSYHACGGQCGPEGLQTVGTGQAVNPGPPGQKDDSGAGGMTGSPPGTAGNGNGMTGMNGGNPPVPTSCDKDGTTHPIDDVWVEKNFKFNCGKDGAVKIIACVTTDSKQELQVGETWVIAGVKHMCVKRERGGAAYGTQSCLQIQCGPEGLQPTSGTGTGTGAGAGAGAGSGGGMSGGMTK